MVEHLRRWLGDQSIQKKLWLFNLLTAIISGVLAAALLLALIRSIEFSAARTAGAIKAAIVAENALPALQFRDVKTAEEILNGLGRDGEALSARIVENDGKVFARFDAQRGDAADRDTGADVIRVNAPMASRGMPLATLELVFATTGVARKFATFSSAVALAILFSLLVSSYVMYRLQRAILGPLTDLTRLMQDVSSGGDLTRRAMVLRHDELGLLGQSFNRM
ncbi:MAG: HAMP domain-containing protein, partial [Propionivibrio sp.]